MTCLIYPSAMSSFDEAFRREQWSAQQQNVQQQSAADRRRRGAEQSARDINESLAQFVRKLMESGVSPKRVELYTEWVQRPFFLGGGKSKPVYSPEGFIIDESRQGSWAATTTLQSVYLATMDGRLYHFYRSSSNGRPHTERHEAVTAQWLLEGGLTLVHPVCLDDDGVAYCDVFDGVQSSTREPVGTILARRAVAIIAGR